MNTETLTCKTCNDTFEREIKRGRKPSQCPDCKGTKVNKTHKSMQPKSKPEPMPHKTAAKVPSGNVVPQLPIPEYRASERLDYKTNKRIPRKLEKTVVLGEQVRVMPTHYKYDSATINGKPYSADDIVKIEGERGTYKVRNFCQQDSDGFIYVDLIGASGNYAGKYRAVGADRIKRA